MLPACSGASRLTECSGVRMESLEAHMGNLLRQSKFQQARIDDLHCSLAKRWKARDDCKDEVAALVEVLVGYGLVRQVDFEKTLHRHRFRSALRQSATVWDTRFTDIVHTPGVLHPILQFTGMASIRHVAACARILRSGVEVSQQYAVRPMRLYLVGGSAGDHRPLASALQFDVSRGDWHHLPSMPTARDVLAAAAIDGNIYAVGGTDGERAFGTVERFDAEDGTWSNVQPMPTPRAGLAAAAVSRSLYTVGGSDGTRALGTVERYNVGTDQWEECPPLLTPRRGVAIAVSHRFVFALGGSDGMETLSTVERFNTEDGLSWEPMPPMPTPRRAAAAAVLNGRLYVVGGAGGISQQDPSLRVAEVFDLQEYTWKALPAMPSGRRGLSLLAAEGVIFALGGSDGMKASNAVEVFDPASEAWEVKPAMPVHRGYFGGVAMQTLEVLGLTVGPASVHQLSSALSRLRGGGRRSL
mmetsp:Transcript_10855/g.20344  ORF Transcript_10855/g.20344 Transcript_10855/m.20344 type:complete len:470 (-) Transcript_10855:92-1501(-)